MKTCYYEVLAVERKANDDEIKKQFKKKAMQLHPDKNHDDPNATKNFQELNEAYQVLSDSNERAWYDSHRTQILSGKDMGEGGEEESFAFNIWEFFSTNCFKGFGDDDAGFYKTYGRVFNDILEEEEEARQMNDELDENLPPYTDAHEFGSTQSSDEDVVNFYTYWSNFVSAKSFAWADEHKASKDYERRVNRMIGQDNKKSRVKEKRKYMDTIRQLIEYVRKRDSRWQRVQEKEKEAEEERKKYKIQKEEEKKVQKKETALRAREAEMQRFQELDRLKEETSNQKGESGEEPEDEEFYCAPCDKGFKSENQLMNHQKSKQHLKAVKDLLSEVAMDDEEHIVQEVQKELDRIESIQKNANLESGKSKKKKKKKGGQQNQQKEADKDQEDSGEETQEASINQKQEDDKSIEVTKDTETLDDSGNHNQEEVKQTVEQQEESEDEEERLKSFMRSKQKKSKKAEPVKKVIQAPVKLEETKKPVTNMKKPTTDAKKAKGEQAKLQNKDEEDDKTETKVKNKDSKTKTKAIQFKILYSFCTVLYIYTEVKE